MLNALNLDTPAGKFRTFNDTHLDKRSEAELRTVDCCKCLFEGEERGTNRLEVEENILGIA